MGDDFTSGLLDTLIPTDSLSPAQMKPRGVGRILPTIGPETIKKVAGQTRPLSDREAAIIKSRFGGAIDTNNIRVGYDMSTSGTTLRGYVISDRLPTIEFYPPDTSSDLSPDLLHETTHVWQNLTDYRFTAPADGYGFTPGQTFQGRGADSQADQMQAGDKPAVDFIRSHPATNPVELGSMAFLDSVRSRYDPGSGDDTTARLGSLVGFKALRAIGNGEFKETVAGLEKKKMPQEMTSVDQAIDQLRKMPQDRQRKILSKIDPDRKKDILKRLQNPTPPATPQISTQTKTDTKSVAPVEPKFFSDPIGYLQKRAGEMESSAQEQVNTAIARKDQGQPLAAVGHQLLSLAPETAGVLDKVAAGLMDWKTAVGVLATKIDPALAAAYFGTLGIQQAGEATQAPGGFVGPENVQNFLLGLSQATGAAAGGGAENSGRAVSGPVQFLKKTGREVLGLGPETVKEAVTKEAEKFSEAKNKASEQQTAENEKTAQANREAVEKHATARRETILANDQAQADHLAQVENVTRENAEAQAQAMDEYHRQVAHVNEVNQAAQDQVSERGRLARDVQDMSSRFGEGVQQAEREARREGNRRYNAVKEAVGDDTRPTAGLTNAVQNARQNILRTPEKIGMFSTIMQEADSQEQGEVLNGENIPPSHPLFQSLVDAGALSAPGFGMEFLQGVYSKTGRALAKGIPDGDVYKAVKSVHDQAGLDMSELAQAHGVEGLLVDAKAYWADFQKTFYDKESAVANTLKRVGKLDPGYYGEPFITGKAANRGIAALGRYSPELARLAESLRDTNRSMQALPKKATLKEAPPEPKVAAKPIPKAPDPGELPGKPELKTAKQVPVPEKPTVDVREAKTEALSKERNKLRGLSRFDWNRIAQMGIAVGGLTGLGVALGHPYEAMVGEAAGAAGFLLTRNAMAHLLDKPKVIEWLTRPQPEDVAILRKLPKDIQDAVRIQINEFVKDEDSHGRTIKPPREIQQFLNESPKAEPKKKKETEQ